MGYVPPLSLAGCPLNEPMYIHHQGGGKIDVMYIIDVCKYPLYHLSYHTPLNDDVCGTCMEFIVMYIIELYIHSTEVSATCKLHVYHHCIIVTYIKISGNVSQKCMYNNKK